MQEFIIPTPTCLTQHCHPNQHICFLLQQHSQIWRLWFINVQCSYCNLILLDAEQIATPSPTEKLPFQMAVIFWKLGLTIHWFLPCTVNFLSCSRGNLLLCRNNSYWALAVTFTSLPFKYVFLPKPIRLFPVHIISEDAADKTFQTTG